ncbi:MAG: alpha/beta fold hydrolase [Acidimicrobiales bacterium]
MDAPTTRYARVGGAHIAYQTVGTGEPVLFMLGLSTHIEAMWDEPALAGFLTRLASFSQLIIFDKRGAGLSDPLGDAATLEAHVDDAMAVLNAVGCAGVTVVCANEASLIALPLAATFPQRVRRLVVINGTARFMRRDDYPIGVEWGPARDYVKKLTDTYGEDRAGIALAASSKLGDAAFEEWAMRYQRLASSPGSFERTTRLVGATDVRAALGVIACPVLVLHRRSDRYIPVEHGHYLADHLADGRLVELDGDDHLVWVGPDTDLILDEVERFVTGKEPVVQSNRMLATILFTDIVGSTEHLASVGDHAWARLVGLHNDLVASIVGRFGGRLVDTTGDGMFALFESPSRGLEAADAFRTRIAELGLTVRAGVHTGEVELVGDAVRGVAVHTAARVMALAESGGIVASRTVRDLVSGSRFRFQPLGVRDLKGLAEPVEVFSVLDDG